MSKSLIRSLWRGLFTAVAMVGLTGPCLPARAAEQPPSSPRPETERQTTPATATSLDDAATWTIRGDSAADYSAQFSGRAVLIMHQGRIVYERYDNGWTASRPHMLASGTKSFTGVMAMFAVQDGLLALDELASDTIHEWRDDPRKSRITIRMLLDLSSGLDPAEDTIGSAGGARLRGGRLSRGEGPRVDDKFAAAIAVEAINEPGKKFVYGPSHFYAFGELLQRKLEARREDDPKFPATVRAYLQARIFGPLNIEVGYLGQDAKGNPNLPGGCFLTAREWVKFGEFVRLNGAVAAATASDPDAKKQLLKPELLAQCFEPSKANPGYGLTWWLPGEAAGGGAGGTHSNDADLPLRERLRARALRAEAEAHIKDASGKNIRVFMAAGLGKQRLYILPDHDLVVVRFAENSTQGRGFDNAEFLKRVLHAR
jgi:CubicO group peptidase (beta-lactamase class C family)